MNSLLTDQMRLFALVGVCGLLWSLESFAPLYQYRKSRLRHTVPNVGLTVLLVLTNLALSFCSAYLSAFTVRHEVGLLTLFSAPVWFRAILGIVALDLFAYFAHVLLHKSWMGWQFHRVHHSENAVDVTTAFRQHPGETVWRTLWQLGCNYRFRYSALGCGHLFDSLCFERAARTRQYQNERQTGSTA